MIKYIEEYKSYYDVTNNGKTITRLDESLFDITSVQVPLMEVIPESYIENEDETVTIIPESEQQKTDEDGNLLFETVYTAVPKEVMVELDWKFDFENMQWVSGEKTLAIQEEDYENLRGTFVELIYEEEYILKDSVKQKYFEDKWTAIMVQMGW